LGFIYFFACKKFIYILRIRAKEIKHPQGVYRQEKVIFKHHQLHQVELDLHSLIKHLKLQRVKLREVDIQRDIPEAVQHDDHSISFHREGHLIVRSGLVVKDQHGCIGL
jgi:hypothetical protein